MDKPKLTVGIQYPADYYYQAQSCYTHSVANCDLGGPVHDFDGFCQTEDMPTHCHSHNHIGRLVAQYKLRRLTPIADYGSCVYTNHVYHD